MHLRKAREDVPRAWALTIHVRDPGALGSLAWHLQQTHTPHQKHTVFLFRMQLRDGIFLESAMILGTVQHPILKAEKVESEVGLWVFSSWSWQWHDHDQSKNTWLQNLQASIKIIPESYLLMVYGKIHSLRSQSAHDFWHSNLAIFLDMKCRKHCEDEARFHPISTP